jgi:hypothetical protein
MRVPSDAVKCGFLLAFVLLLPFETDLVIATLVRAFENVAGDDRMRLVEAFAELLFPNSESPEADRLFVSLLYMCGLPLFKVPTPGRELRLWGEKLVFFDHGVGRTYAEEVGVAITETKPFPFPESVDPRWLVPPETGGEVLDMKRFSKLNERIGRAKVFTGKLGREEVTESRTRLTEFDFDRLFVGP